MNTSEVERFASDLRSMATLSAEVMGKTLADTVGIANGHGYRFTVDEARTFLKAKAKAAGKELPDSALDKVAGGYHRCQIF